MEIIDFYGQSTAPSIELKEDVTLDQHRHNKKPNINTKVSFESKSESESEPIPENAEILSKNVDINIREIENGYIRRTTLEISYCTYDKNGNKQHGFFVKRKEIYTSEKPKEELLNYGI